MSRDGVHIDVNADLGEGYGAWTFGADELLLDAVSSANVACGFHAGDPATIWRTASACSARGVAIGAQVSYPDILGFGRRFIDMEPVDLTAAVLYQIGALQAFAAVSGSKVSYVKAHGALNNAIWHHSVQAEAVVRAVREYDPALPVLAMPGSQLEAHADRAGIECVAEAYADRAYQPDGQLVSRRFEGSVLHDPRAIAEQVERLVADGTVISADGSSLTLSPRSICLHGDSPAAAKSARAIRRRLGEIGVDVKAFAS